MAQKQKQHTWNMLLSSAYICEEVALKMALIRAIEFGKTKTKVIVLANHERHSFGFEFISNWVTKWRECSKPVARDRKPNQVQITLDTQHLIAPAQVTISL